MRPVRAGVGGLEEVTMTIKQSGKRIAPSASTIKNG